MSRFIRIITTTLTFALILCVSPLSSLASVKATSLAFTKSTDARLSVTRSLTRAAVSEPAGIAVTYSSSDIKIASVDENGRVRGATLGTAVITASAGGLTVSYNVTVVPLVKFDDDSDLSLDVGKTAVRKATASPEGKVVYRSSDAGVAAVDGAGKVTAKGTGTAKITASSAGGRASYDVTVGGKGETGRKRPGTDAEAREAARIVELVNEYRKKQGLPALKATDEMMDAAQLRAEELVRNYSHTRPGGGKGWEAAKGFVNLSGYFKLGENIARKQISAAHAMEAWLGSRPHHANIVDKTYTMIGVGCYEHNGEYHWVQLFAYPG